MNQAMMCQKPVPLDNKGRASTYCVLEQGHKGPCWPDISIANMYGVVIQSKVEASPNKLGVK